MTDTPKPSARTLRAALCIAVATACNALGDTPWRSALYPETWGTPGPEKTFGKTPFLPDFSMAGFEYGKEIPTGQNWEMIDATASPFSADPAGKTDSTTSIQRAIDLAVTQSSKSGNPVVVSLPAGTYRVSVPEGKKEALRIHGPGVVLRGAGAAQTFLLNTTREMRGKVILRVAPYNAALWMNGVDQADGRILLSKDITGPSTRIPVADSSGFEKGSWVCIGQNLTPEWVAENGDPSWIDPANANAPRGLRYLRKVTAIAPGEIAVDLPVRFALLLRDGAFVRRVHPPMENTGIESLAIANLEIPLETGGWGDSENEIPGSGGYLGNQAAAVQFKGVANGWIRDVASFSPPENQGASHITSFGVRLRDSRSITLERVRFSHPQYGGKGGNGYMFDIRDTGESLLRDCHAAFSRHGFSVSGMASAGNVLHACTDSDTARYTGGAKREDPLLISSGAGSDYHMHFAHANLVDSCTFSSSRFSAVFRPYGTGALHAQAARFCVFWNIRGEGAAAWPVGEDGRESLGQDVVWSGQDGTGIVIGTSGSRPGVRIDFPRVPDSTATDFLEGVGKGTSLVPQSLWLDQRARKD